MISILASLIFSGLVLLVQASWAGEKLVYAVVFKGSSNAASKTEILSVQIRRSVVSILSNTSPVK